MWFETLYGKLINFDWYSSISVDQDIIDDKFEVRAYIVTTGEDSWWTPLSAKFETRSEAEQEFKKIKRLLNDKQE